MNLDNFSLKLDLKSKFFKQSLLEEIKQNGLQLLNKKIVPDYKSSFLITLTVKITDAKKLKEIIKKIELEEKEKELFFLEQKRKEYGF